MADSITTARTLLAAVDKGDPFYYEPHSLFATLRGCVDAWEAAVNDVIKTARERDGMQEDRDKTRAEAAGLRGELDEVVKKLGHAVLTPDGLNALQVAERERDQAREEARQMKADLDRFVQSGWGTLYTPVPIRTIRRLETIIRLQLAKGVPQISEAEIEEEMKR